MRALFIPVALLALCLGSDAQETKTAAKFGKKLPLVGEVIRSKLTGSMDLTVETKIEGQAGPPMTRSMSSTEETIVTVLATGQDKRVTKIKLEVSEDTETGTGRTEKEVRELPLHGETLLGSLKNDQWKFTEEDGNEVTGKKATAAREKLGDGQFRGQLLALIDVVGGKKIEKGKKLSLTPTQVSRLLTQREQPANLEENLSDMSLTLTKFEEFDGKECGVFDLKFTKSHNAEGRGPDVTGPFKGRVWVEVKTGWLRVIDVLGELKFSGLHGEGKGMMEFGGGGSTTIKCMVAIRRKE